MSGSVARRITEHFNGDWHGDYGAFPAPGHSDKDRGMTVTDAPDAPDGVLINSFNGGDPLAVKDECRRIGLIGEREWQSRADAERVTGTYVYRSASGRDLFRTVRKEQAGKRKRFVAERLDGGRWIAGLRKVERVPYRLPELLSADASKPVYFVEGERKADKLVGMGFVATAVPFGCKGWRADYASHFNGRTVIILPDNDDKGRTFAAKVKASIEGVGGKASTLELPGLPLKGDIIDWVGTAAELEALSAAKPSKAAPARPTIQATIYACRDPHALPPRPWIYGRQFLRGSLSVVLAPGAIGKTSLLIGTALAIATGRPLLGKTSWEGPKRVWLWNLEDSMDELSKLIEAARLHWKIEPGDISDRLFVDSALEGAELCTATEDNAGFRILEPVIDALVDELIARGVDLLVVDPFVSSHSVSENNNGAIDAVAKRWARVAVRANCAVCLVHHTRKLNGAEATAEGGRGAVALPNAARSVVALNRMSEAEATALQVVGEDRRRFFRAYDDKNNRAPPADASDWYQLLSVDLGNGTVERPSDHIGVVAPWTAPDLFTGVTADHLLQVQGKVADGNYRRSEQTDDWVGEAVAQVLGIDVSDRKGSEAKRVKRMVASWISNGALVVVNEKDGSRKDRPFIRVGTPASDSATP